MNPEHLLASIRPSANGHVEGLDPETAAALEEAGYIRAADSRVYRLTRHGWRRRAELDAARGFTGAPRGGTGSTLET
jgi:hypothetical protein